MNKYKNLAMNTVIFAVGSFSSKIFSLLLNNLYTKHFSPSGFYTKTLLDTLLLFMVPVFTFSLTEAVVRFGLDRKHDKAAVFTTAAVITAGGLAVMALLSPFLRFIPFLRQINGYTFLLVVYILASSARALCSQFVRAREMVKLFSLDGILTTMTMFIFSLIFISGMDMGVSGFMLAGICSDLGSAVFLFIAAGLRRYFDMSRFDAPLGKKMLRFSLPLVPTAVMWTFTGFSDQIFIGNIHSDKVFTGVDAAGIYSAATKVPNLVSMVATVFFQAWNMSAITENESADREAFYEKVFASFEAMLFIGAAGLMLILRPLSALIINYSTFPEYATAYRYTPLLIAAAVFTCLSFFLNGIYTATGHTKNAFWSIFAVCMVNIVLNLCLIPEWGIQGAALATFMSYLLCYCIRMIDARYYVPFRFSPAKNFLNTGLLLTMCGFWIFQPSGYFIMLVLTAAVIAALNFRPMLLTVNKLLRRES
ncbi:MAG: polysaccharide biosynthesis C-terminal domain-containing protein [Ruminococcus sp.]|nr:polysaccharide biosynthesis C-terminal domain-containing protein [Ruminococcus sp.]